MAFEAFRAQDTKRPKRGRRITYAVSIAFHGVLIAVGVAYSFWHVDELTPPSLHVTFLSGTAPPPPPPPPPAAGGGAKKKIASKPKVTPVVPRKPTEIVQPREQPKDDKPPEKPKPDDDDDETDAPGEKGGVKGGTIGGTPGGTIGGTIGGKPGGVIGGTIGGTGTGAPAKFLPPNLGALQKVTGADPPFPPSLRRAGSEYAVIAKICVSPAGAVSSVTLMKKADPLLDEGVVTTVKTWKFRPLMAGSAAIPFCYPATFQFKGQ